jgi:hypothetical protein
VRSVLSVAVRDVLDQAILKVRYTQGGDELIASTSKLRLCLVMSES